MNTDIVVIEGTGAIKELLTAEFGGVQIDIMEILPDRIYGVPYGAKVTINNTSTYIYNIRNVYNSTVILGIHPGSSTTYIAVRDIYLYNTIPPSTDSE